MPAYPRSRRPGSATSLAAGPAYPTFFEVPRQNPPCFQSTEEFHRFPCPHPPGGGCRLCRVNIFRRLRSSPHFAKLFAFVHPFFWQVRVWSLHRLLRAYRAADVENLLYSTNPYGIIRIVFTCDKRKPAATPWWRPETT